MRLVITLAAILSAAAPAQAQPLGQRIQARLLGWQKDRLLRKVGTSPYTSTALKQEVTAARSAIDELQGRSDRVVFERGKGLLYYQGGSLIGQVAVTRSGDQKTLAVTTQTGATAQRTQEVFTTGRNALKLVVDELGLGLRGRKEWRFVVNQIRQELKHGTYTAGSESISVEDLGRSDLTDTTHRVELWLARGTGVPRSSEIQDAPARHAGRAVLGRLTSRSYRYVLDAQGNRVPHPDPEAEVRPMRETLSSFAAGYHVDPSGTPVFHAEAQ